MTPRTASLRAVTLLTDDDLYLFNEGTHRTLAAKLGAHPLPRRKIPTTYFAVWAPNAAGVSVIGDFNEWDATADPLQPRASSGIWEGTARGAEPGQVYKYAITTPGGERLEKADPVALRSEEPPRTGSVIWKLDYKWGDDAWMAKRAERIALDAPVATYEVHLGSWMRDPAEPGRLLGYREVAPRLVEYVLDAGFTHVELLPIMEHPFYGSWGYQVTGYFAPTSRYGTPQDFMALIDELHQAGIGVVLDWVPSHFPNDEFALARFDGTHLYEHADPRLGVHPDWNSLVFNYGRNEVRSFLASSAEHWLSTYHADGLRFDAVASMLYRDYSRRDGEWVPNRLGGRENLEAIEFLQALNAGIYAEHPDVHTVAEESTAWPGVSRPVDAGGLGFGYKWDMGWMHDTLEYVQRDPIHRQWHHDLLTFRAVYASTENFVLPLSHDEVVHGKGSLLDKMPGDDWQKFANLRLLLGYQYAQPGKKLLFMGCEFGQRREWDHESSLDWHLLDVPDHAGVQQWVRDLNAAYRHEGALHELDCEPGGFAWARIDAGTGVLSFLRTARHEPPVLVVCNFTPVARYDVAIDVPHAGAWREVLNSDAEHYGGSGVGNLGGVETEVVPWEDGPHSVRVTAPPTGVRAPAPRGARVTRPPATPGPARPPTTATPPATATPPEVSTPVAEQVTRSYLDAPPLGAVPSGPSAAGFRVWAPDAERVRVHLLDPADRVHELEPEGGGYHHAEIDGVVAGTRYRYLLPDGAELADPASRWQPDGVLGPSALFDAGDFVWTDDGFDPPPLWSYVVYELHVGTFTDEGTLDGAIGALDHIATLGANAVEPMPIAQFPGTRNWGYDGVFPFAVHDSYGGPRALQRFVDACHRRGLAVVLDVVYNHVGPEGNVLPSYGPYFTDHHRTPWGEAVNVDGPQSDEVRRYFVHNALMWLSDFHVDALRLDAVHGIVDTTARPFLLELSEATRALGRRRGRPLYLVAESADNDPRVVTPPAAGGLDMDGQWNDDFHHALHSVLTNESTGYYRDFGRLEQLARSISEGFVYQGEHSGFRGRRHGAPSGEVPPARFVVFGQNHDQVGNRPGGDRPSGRLEVEQLRLSAALLLLSPYVPLLFMGEEYGETAPFPYFVDHGSAALLEAVRAGRAAELRDLGYETPPLDPGDPRTFELARPDRTLRAKGDHARIWATYRGLVELRRSHPALARSSRTGTAADVCAPGVLRMVRHDDLDGSTAVVLGNVGAAPASLRPAPGVAPLPGQERWRKLADSAAVDLGGEGAELPAELTGDGELVLGPWAFCVYGS
jgi:1,4-alpha-glucan branching enzyme